MRARPSAHTSCPWLALTPRPGAPARRITHEDPAYDRMMGAVRQFVEEEEGGAHDVAVGEVFTAEMYEQLERQMAAQGWEGLAETRARWEGDLQSRRIVSGFLKDKAIGSKRLASMPDRMTNTIRTADGGTAHRPTVINCYADAPLDSVAAWWEQWRAFIFERPLPFAAHMGVAATSQPPALLFRPIPRAKYPALSAEEEAISVPLQTLSLAIFDAIMVHMMGSVARTTWQPLRAELCAALNERKPARTLEILSRYSGSEDPAQLRRPPAPAGVICLQEASTYLVGELRSAASAWSVHAGRGGKRDQNSVVMLRREEWDEALEDVTAQVDEVAAGAATRAAGAKRGAPWSGGDLHAVVVKRRVAPHAGESFLVASFHGDTNGLLTVPLLRALAVFRHDIAIADGAAPRLLLGIDSNAYERPKDGGWLGVDQLEAELARTGECSNGRLGLRRLPRL